MELDLENYRLLSRANFFENHGIGFALIIFIIVEDGPIFFFELESGLLFFSEDYLEIQLVQRSHITFFMIVEDDCVSFFDYQLI